MRDERKKSEVGPAVSETPRDLQGERAGRVSPNSGRHRMGETALTCASLCLLQLQKLLQEAAIISKLVGNRRVVCIRNSRPETEDKESEPQEERQGPASPVRPQHSHLMGPKTCSQTCLGTTESSLLCKMEHSYSGQGNTTYIDVISTCNIDPTGSNSISNKTA